MRPWERGLLLGVAGVMLVWWATACQDRQSPLWTVADIHPQVDLGTGHQALQCNSCHADGASAGPAKSCADCHLADYMAATSPEHRAAGYPTRCAECHNSDAWRPARIDHAALGFALTGAHQRVLCSGCHGPGTPASLPTDCWACHQADYTATTEPDHSRLELAHACAPCHTTAAWRPASFDHTAVGFALTGAHASTRCSRCHAAGAPAPLPTDCWSCHQADYSTAVNPDHRALAHACDQCHSTSAWRPARFDHSLGRFPLTGAHASAACVGCHAGGRYSGTPIACNDCHAADAPANHFGPGCASCHGTQAWKPATFSHEAKFPLTKGEHKRYATRCASCHLVAGDYAAYTCTDCHDNEHTQSQMDSKHRGVQRYLYDSTSCYKCHPKGGGDDTSGGGDG